MVLESFWGQAEHALHHFLPHIPWYKYKSVWALANGVFRKQGIPQRKVSSAPIPEFKEKMLNGSVADDGRRTVEARVAAITASLPTTTPDGERTANCSA